MELYYENIKKNNRKNFNNINIYEFHKYVYGKW